MYRASQLRQKGIKCETGQHSNQIYDADLWVVSPGISKEADIIIEAQKKKIRSVKDFEKIISDVLQSNEKTMLIAIYNNQNQRRYIGVKLD